MKSSIFFLLFLSIYNSSFSQKNVIITGALKNFYPTNYKANLNIPFSKANPKAYSSSVYQPEFISKDSFYYKFQINKAGIYSILFNDIYLLPGDSIHLNYYFEDENRNLKDSFTSIFSRIGFIGNIGYENFIKHKKAKIKAKINSLKNAGNIDAIIDSIYSRLSTEIMNYESKHKVSSEYKQIIEKDLFFEKFDSKMKFAYNDSAKLLHLIKDNSRFFNDEEFNTRQYFSAIGDIPEGLYSIYKKPDFVILVLRNYLSGESYNYASLIFAKILQHKLPSYNNPFSKKIALNVLTTTSDKDLIALANSIINKKSDGDKINKIMKGIEVQNYNGRITTIGKIIENTASALKYLDFWASWCGPCIEAIPYTKNIENKFGDENIQSIIISIDYDIKKWKNFSDRLGINRVKSYCILNKKNFETLDSIMNIAPIPHYILIDKNNEIQLLRAPDAKSINQEFISSFLNKNKQKEYSGTNQLPPPL